MRGVPLLRAPRTLAPAEADALLGALLTNWDRAITTDPPQICGQLYFISSLV
jgi:hypothetical protein